MLFLIIATTSFCNGNFGLRCKEIIDYSNRLFLWSAEGDCCYWTGVVCDDAADHILELHLSDSYYSSRLSGKINPSLLDLKHLTHLDLSDNEFHGIQIPSFLSSLKPLNISTYQEQSSGE